MRKLAKALSQAVDTAVPDMLTRVDKVKPHQFTVEDVTYEWMNGAYYKKVGMIKQGKSFGELALIKEDVRKATVKCEEDCHFATLDQTNFTSSL